MGAKCVKASVVQGTGMFGRTYLECEFEGGEKKQIDFFPDEIWMGPEDGLGKTYDQILEAKRAKDLAYLRS